MSDEKIEASMSIILNAGEARVFCQKALDNLADNSIEIARQNIKMAQNKIVEAHKTQTDAIQGEARGEVSEYSLLFAHAQDTLMTIYSEINLAKQLIKIFEKLNIRLEKLESNDGVTN